jgi:hypothetical protein
MYVRLAGAASTSAADSVSDTWYQIRDDRDDERSVGLGRQQGCGRGRRDVVARARRLAATGDVVPEHLSQHLVPRSAKSTWAAPGRPPSAGTAPAPPPLESHAPPAGTCRSPEPCTGTSDFPHRKLDFNSNKNRLTNMRGNHRFFRGGETKTKNDKRTKWGRIELFLIERNKMHAQQALKIHMVLLEHPGI